MSVWEIISKVYEEIGIPIDDIKTLRGKTTGDEKVWDIYKNGLTASINQCSTDSGKIQVMRYKPTTVEELTAFVAGIRPSFASMKDYLLDRIPFSYDIPEFDEILKTSMNFVLYQENIMATLVFAGIPEDETYSIVKAISKKNKDKIISIKERFLNGFIEKTHSEENANKVWKIIEDASAYGFNSAHALSYAYDSLYGAYLKSHYPLQYYSVTLNLYENDLSETSKLINELSYFDIKLSDIKFGKSKAKYNYDVETNTIYKGIKSIKYLNETVADELFQLANTNYFNNPIDLFVAITEKTSIDTRQMKILIKLNFFNDYGNDKYLFELYELFLKRYKTTHKLETKNKRINELKDLMKFKKDQPKYTIKELASFQQEYLGFITLTDEAIDIRNGIVLDISDKYKTRWISIYHIKNGKYMQYKIYYSTLAKQNIKVGDYVKLVNIEKKFKKMQVDGEWKDTSEQYLFIGDLMNLEEKE